MFEIFLDSFNLKDILKYQNILSGITTNPSIMAEHLNIQDTLNSLFKLEDFKINLQVKDDLADKMIQQGLKLSNLNKNIVVKIPLTCEGIKAIKFLSSQNIKTNGTLCFSLLQALKAQDAGASYISPFLGRMEDAGCDIETFCKILNEKITTSKILAASVRNEKHLDLAFQYAHSVTVGSKILDSVFESSLLINGRSIFAKAYKDLF